jgi:hypothetical protein
MRNHLPGFQPNGDKGLKRQVLSHAMRTGDSLKSFGVDDFSKAPKSTVDAVFTGRCRNQQGQNQLSPLNNMFAQPTATPAPTCPRLN